MTNYKLTYFPIKALAEPIRFLLSYGKMKFEDIRIEKEQWMQVKERMPFGQVPVLEVDGKVAHQSVAIARFVAKRIKLSGKNDLEDLEIDAMVDTICDLRSKIATFNVEKDKSKKQAIKDQLLLELLPFYLSKLDEGCQNGYLCLGRLTWADFYFVGLLDYMNGVMEMDLLENYPNLRQLQSTILALPAIQEWVQKRPYSKY